MYITRILGKKLRSLSKQFPVVALTGPRQSGKTTLVRQLFSSWRYVSLEALDTREFAEEDPRGFLREYSGKVIIDEAQRVAGLFSYLQEMVDETGKPGQFILTGSQNFLLHERISQSLAGRVALTTLLPLSLAELTQAGVSLGEYRQRLFAGLYPRVYGAPKVAPRDWYRNYLSTYIERDVRQMKNIADLRAFKQFVKLCAGRTGQLLNLSALAADVGITHNTAKSWLSVLEASYLVYVLEPHHRNFRKRLVKMPKLYFWDTGLACSLVGIEEASQLTTHPLSGPLFETMIVTELVKRQLNVGEIPNTTFWRDKLGHEIDCVIDTAGELKAIEIKSGQTVNSDYFKDLEYWSRLTGHRPENAFVVYGGARSYTTERGSVVSWKDMRRLK